MQQEQNNKIELGDVKSCGTWDIAKDIQGSVREFMKLKGPEKVGKIPKLRRIIAKVINRYFELCGERLLLENKAIYLYRIGEMRQVSKKVDFVPRKYIFKREGGKVIREERIGSAVFDGLPWYYIDWNKPIKYKRFKFVPSKLMVSRIMENRSNKVPVLDYTK